MTCRTAKITRIAPTPAQIIDRLAAMRRALAAVEQTAAAALDSANLLASEIRRLENLARTVGAPARPHPMAAGAMTLVEGGAA